MPAYALLDSGNIDGARACAKQILRAAQSREVHTEAHVLAFLAHCYRLGEPQLQNSCEASRRAAQLFESMGDREGEARALITLAHVTLILGRNDESVETALMAARLCDGSNGALPVLAYNILGLAYSWTGDEQRADDALESAVLQAKLAIPPLSPYQPRLNQMWVEVSRLQHQRYKTGQMGSLARLKYFASECDRLQSAGQDNALLPGLQPIRMAISFASTGFLAAWQNDHARAETYLQKARESLPAFYSWLNCLVLCCEAEMAWAKGNLLEAEQSFSAMKAMALGVEHTQFAARAQLLLAQVLEQQGKHKSALIEHQELRLRERQVVEHALRSREELVSWQLESRRREAELRRVLADSDTAIHENKAKTQFLATASHDLRQPIHSMNVLIAALGLRDLDIRTAEIVGLLNSVNRTLAQQLDGLLDISRLDAGVLVPHFSVERIDLLISSIHTMFEPLAREKRIALELDAGPEVSSSIDAALLARILGNLIDNALKFTGENGRVRLSVRALEDRIFIQVDDNGIGVARHDQHRIFEEYFQAGNRDKAKGLGLGLSIVKRLSNLLGIQLEFRSAPYVGTTVTLTLKAARSAAIDVDERGRPPICKSGLSILVVDDEDHVRQSMRYLLHELDCTVHLAEGTVSATAISRDHPIDALVTDWRLSGSDTGEAVIKAVQSIHPAVFVMILTGDASREIVQQAQSLGVSILRKPAELTEILRAINQRFAHD